MMSGRCVIIGGVAGGATAAARLMRLTNKFHVTMLERGPDVSIATCGLPYFIGREIEDRSKMTLHTPQSLMKAVNVSSIRANTEATYIDRKNKRVGVVSNGKKEELEYDKLMITTGASPLYLPIPGLKHDRIVPLRNLQDMDKIDRIVRDPWVNRVAVLGAGFIGIEIAEQLRRQGKEVIIVEKAPAILPLADDELGKMLEEPLIKNGIKVITGDGLTSVKHTEKKITFTLESGNVIEVDSAILCIGVKPESGLAKDCGLTVSPNGCIPVDNFMRTNDPNIYAMGDVVETWDRIIPDQKTWVPLGNVANIQARIAADHVVFGDKAVPWRGSLGSAIVRAFNTTLAVTGWSEKQLKKIGYKDFGVSLITVPSHASYYPGSAALTLKLTFDKNTGRILGGQGIGEKGIDKRIDVIAAAIYSGMTIDDLSQLQLTYSPPFGSARDPCNVAALYARNVRDGLVVPSTDRKDAEVIDTRPTLPDGTKEEGPVDNVTPIVFNEIKENIPKLEPSKPYKMMCAWGRTAYFGARTLQNAGFRSVKHVMGGWRVQMAREKLAAEAAARAKITKN